MANKISVVIDVVVDRATQGINGFKKAVTEADGAANKFKAGAGSAFDSLKANAVGFGLAGGAALAAFGAKAVDASSNLSESMNAVDVTFGDTADTIHDLGETSVEAFGLSERAFNEATVKFSSFAKTVAGEGGDVAATMDELITRATDFASVHNIEMADAMALFQSTLAGESEPIRRYGKDLSAAAVENYALANGLIKSKSEMTEAIKVQARYGLLMEQTNDVAGDFANTSGSLANQQKILAARAEDLTAAFGSALLPVIEDGIRLMNGLTTAAEDLGDTGFVKLLSKLGLLNNVFGVTLDMWDRGPGSLIAMANGVEKNYMALGKMADKTAGATKGFSDYVKVTDDAGSATEQITDAVYEAVEAHDAETAAIHRVNDARLESIDNIYGARAAERDWWAQVQETQAVLDDSTAGTLERSAALDALALQTAETTAKQLAANGVDINSASGQKQYLDALRNTASGLTGPMRDALLEYIALLDGIPTQKVTTLSVIQGGSVDGRGPKGRRAAGGPVTAGDSYLVGEQGPELITPSANGFVHTASKTAGMLGGSGTTIIQVDARGRGAAEIANEIARKQRFNR